MSLSLNESSTLSVLHNNQYRSKTQSPIEYSVKTRNGIVVKIKLILVLDFLKMYYLGFLPRKNILKRESETEKQLVKTKISIYKVGTRDPLTAWLVHHSALVRGSSLNKK